MKDTGCYIVGLVYNGVHSFPFLDCIENLSDWDCPILIDLIDFSYDDCNLKTTTVIKWLKIGIKSTTDTQKKFSRVNWMTVSKYVCKKVQI